MVLSVSMSREPVIELQKLLHGFDCAPDSTVSSLIDLRSLDTSPRQYHFLSSCTSWRLDYMISSIAPARPPPAQLRAIILPSLDSLRTVDGSSIQCRQHASTMWLVWVALMPITGALAVEWFECASLAATDCPPATCGATIAAAMRACSRQAGGTVVLGPGIFHLNDTLVTEMAPLITLSNIRGVALVGSSGSNRTNQGTTQLLIYGARAGFALDNVQQVRFADFEIDMVRLPYTYGRCTAVTANSFTITFDPAVYPFASPVPAYLTKIMSIMEFDPLTWRMAQDPIDIYATSNPFSATVNLANSTLTVHGIGSTQDQRFRVNASFILRHQVWLLPARLSHLPVLSTALGK